MHIIINNSSMVPIYEQIVDQIKAAIVVGDIKPGDLLPSVRQQSKDLRISALTAKKAYDALEEEGFVTTVHGKGTFVSETNKDRIYEEQVRDVEKDMSKAVLKARQSGIKDDERDSVPEGAFLFTYKVCSMTGLYQTPKIKVTDDKGNEVQLDYDEEKNLFSCKYEYSEELKEQYSEFVIEAMTKYATWMQNDYDSDFYRIKPYFDQNTQLYEDIRLNPRLFVWEHDGYKFENVETSEFFDYGGVISCRVKFDHILTKRGKEDYVDKNDHTVYLREVDGEYKIFYMVSH